MLKTVKKLKNKISVIMVSLVLFLNSYCYADIVSEVNGGGEIENSKIAQGAKSLIQDLTGTLQKLIPFIAVLFIVYFAIRMMMGEDQERMIYKKRIITTFIILILSFSAVTIINLIAKYFV